MTRSELAAIFAEVRAPRDSGLVSLADALDSFTKHVDDGTHRIRGNLHHLVRAVQHWKQRGGVREEDTGIAWMIFKWWISSVVGDDAHPDDYVMGGYDLLGDFVIRELDL